MSARTTPHSPAEALFEKLTRRPWLAVLLGFVITASCAAGLPGLVKDTSVEAFIPRDHPSVTVRDRAEEIFGLRDPIIVALVTPSRNGIYQPGALEQLRSLHQAIAALDNVRADRVMSLASESSISGDDVSLDIEPYFPDGPVDDDAISSLRQRVAAMPPHVGTLVSEDGSGAMIIAELVDEDLASDSYERIVGLAKQTEQPGLEVHVAGQAAVGGYLSRFIDEDARRLQPAAIVVIIVVVFLTFLKARAVFGPLLVIVGAAVGTVGAMAWLGTPYYAITSALPVVIIAIAVADAIHIMTRFYELREERPGSTTRGLVIEAMADMWKPVTLTTLTTAAGFVGIAVASVMPPIALFGWYAALGVLLAWFYSLFALPNLMIILKLNRSPAFARWHREGGDPIARTLTRVSLASAAHPGAALGGMAVLAVIAAVGASQLRIDRSLVENFRADEPVRIADGVLNDTFAGSSMLDVMVTTDAPDGLLNARRLRKMAALQDFMESQPFVDKTVAITDYLDRLHVALAGGPGESGDGRALPDEDNAIAQYLLMYEASGDPTELEEEIDLHYQHALVRGFMTSSLSSEERPVVAEMERYLEETFNEPGLTGLLSGRVNVDYHWMNRLAASHFESLAISLLLILGASIALFRGLLPGIVSIAPVSFAILCIYGVMGVVGVYLEPSTSMFAAISLGLGVDYAIHLISRIHRVGEGNIQTVRDAILARFPAANRACFFNALALAAGFSVLLLSELATLQRFGGLIAVAAVSGFLGALVLVPAVFALRSRRDEARLKTPATGHAVVLLAFGSLAFSLACGEVRADDGDMSARLVAERVAGRPVGSAVERELQMTLTDRRGKTRERGAVVLRKTAEGVRKIRFSFTSPKSIRDTTFLSHDPEDPAEDDNRWLYLPATGKVRRIPPSDRGDYFLGTDFTYEDIDSQLKFDLDDYEFSLLQAQPGDGDNVVRIAGKAASDAVRQELGYGGFSAVIDTGSWMPVRIEFQDPAGQPLKTVNVLEVEQVAGIWEARAISVENHQTGHSTSFRYTRIDFGADIPDAALTPTGLRW
ncbi:MAG: outer membrane lipoprotein-sorting protein [Gammaproteobacteria bacterium]